MIWEMRSVEVLWYTLLIGRFIFSSIKESHQDYIRHFWLKERRGTKSSVRHENHLGFRPTITCAPSLSSVIIKDLSVPINFCPGVRVLPGEVDVGAAVVVVPPSSGSRCCTTPPAQSILVSVPGQRWGDVSVFFLFIFWLSPRAEFCPIVVLHWVS